MHITFVDDSIAFDGYSPINQALGGFEKALASLPAALVRRGHQVCVVNRCDKPAVIEGVQWVPFDLPRPPQTDVVIAFRKPELLGEIAGAAKKILWMASPAQVLNKPVNQAIMEKHNPIVVFMGNCHYRTWQPWKDFRKAILTPGVRAEYLSDSASDPVDPPRAIVTTNPMHGLGWLLGVWAKEMQPRCVGAELHVYSAGLFKGLGGASVAEKLQPIFDLAQSLKDKGVVICKPGPDPVMAAAFRSARVHLYPGFDKEMYCSTLAESQATGLPAVARPVGAVTERIKNGQTGFLVPDADAFSNVALHLMTNRGAWDNMNKDARMMQRGRTWDVVAAELEALL